MTAMDGKQGAGKNRLDYHWLKSLPDKSVVTLSQYMRVFVHDEKKVVQAYPSLKGFQPYIAALENYIGKNWQCAEEVLSVLVKHQKEAILRDRKGHSNTTKQMLERIAESYPTEVMGYLRGEDAPECSIASTLLIRAMGTIAARQQKAGSGDEEDDLVQLKEIYRKTGVLDVPSLPANTVSGAASEHSKGVTDDRAIDRETANVPPIDTVRKLLEEFQKERGLGDYNNGASL